MATFMDCSTRILIWDGHLRACRNLTRLSCCRHLMTASTPKCNASKLRSQTKLPYCSSTFALYYIQTGLCSWKIIIVCFKPLRAEETFYFCNFVCERVDSQSSKFHHPFKQYGKSTLQIKDVYNFLYLKWMYNYALRMYRHCKQFRSALSLC
jgi:hypothetical protein